MITIDEWNNYIYKSLWVWTIMCLVVLALISFGRMLDDPSTKNIGFTIVVGSIVIILILMYLKVFHQEYLDKDLKRELGYTKYLLDRHTVRYERVIVSGWAFQFRLKKDLDNLLLKELRYFSESFMEVKKTDYGIWLIIYRKGHEPDEF